MDKDLTTCLDGICVVYTYEEMGQVRVTFDDGCLSFEWLEGPLKGVSGENFAYRARKVGSDRFFINWHEPETRGFVTVYIDFDAGEVCSSVFAAYGTDDEQVFFHNALIDNVQGR